MEFSALGKHCQFEGCNQRDFLPFECSCKKTLCLNHKSRADHGCPDQPRDNVVATPPAVRKENKKPFKCSKKGCKGRELQAVVCKGCAQNFCLPHRFPHDHACESLTKKQPQPKVSLAQSIAAQNCRSAVSSAGNSNLLAMGSRLLRTAAGAGLVTDPSSGSAGSASASNNAGTSNGNGNGIGAGAGSVRVRDVGTAFAGESAGQQLHLPPLSRTASAH